MITYWVTCECNASFKIGLFQFILPNCLIIHTAWRISSFGCSTHVFSPFRWSEILEQSMEHITCIYAVVETCISFRLAARINELHTQRVNCSILLPSRSSTYHLLRWSPVPEKKSKEKLAWGKNETVKEKTLLWLPAQILLKLVEWLRVICSVRRSLTLKRKRWHTLSMAS